MSFSVPASPEQLALLRTVLNEHCIEFGIDANHSTMRDTIASRILSLFENGVNGLEELKLKLKEDGRI